MFGTSFFLIPGIGPLLAAGPIVSALEGTVVAQVAGKSLSHSLKWRGLEGTVVVGGWSALGTCLYNMGIPEDSNIEYESYISRLARGNEQNSGCHGGDQTSRTERICRLTWRGNLRSDHAQSL
jgi:hypothetical protein